MTDGMIGHGHGDELIPESKGALVGFRRWTVRGDRLGSPHKANTYWEPGVNSATCKSMPHPKRSDLVPGQLLGGIADALLGGHLLVAGEQRSKEPVPHKRCRCGLYAYHAPQQLGRIDEAASAVRGEVAGACLLWGRVEVHQSGFRAERALPILLVRSSAPTGLRSRIEQSKFDGWDAQLKAVARKYGMTIVEPEHLLERASALGRLYTPDLYDAGV